MKDIEDKYYSANENIMEKEGTEKKLGTSKRLVNDIIINIKTNVI